MGIKDSNSPSDLFSNTLTHCAIAPGQDQLFCFERRSHRGVLGLKPAVHTRWLWTQRNLPASEPPCSIPMSFLFSDFKESTCTKAGAPYSASSHWEGMLTALKLIYLVKHQNKHLFSLRQKARRIKTQPWGTPKQGHLYHFPQMSQSSALGHTHRSTWVAWLLLCHPTISSADSSTSQQPRYPQ